MEHDPRRQRAKPVHLPFGFAPQVLPALQVAEWLTSHHDGKRHRTQPGEEIAPIPRRHRRG